MKLVITRSLCCRAVCGALAVSLVCLPMPAIAAPSVALATSPLANATVNVEVLPNLMVVFDDSGSMAWNYLPDWASGASTERFRNNDYNKQFYNPAVVYNPPVLYNTDGSQNTTTYQTMDGTTTVRGADTTKTLPNWMKVREDAYGNVSGTTTVDLSQISERMVYVVKTFEYCSDTAWKNCTQLSAPNTTYKYPAPVRWCKDSTNAGLLTPAANSCQKVRVDVTPTFSNLRSPAARTSNVTVGSVSGTVTVTSIKVNGQEILSTTVSANSQTALRDAVIDSINACNGIITGNCTVAGFAATPSSTAPNIVITAGEGTIATPVKTGTANLTFGSFSNNTAFNNAIGYRLLRIITPGTTAVFPYPGSNVKATTRTDCAGSLCTGNEEMRNFANWNAYYQTRNQAMKTAISLAFKDVSARYRIGLTAQAYSGYTDGTRFLHIDKYELTHKNKFLTTLFGLAASGSTPTRHGLAKVGKIYAHKPHSGSAADPVQYACQANYAFVATDGYWNTGNEYGSFYTNVDNSANIGNMDGGSTPRPYKEGTTATSNSLADIGRYYSVTDLRTPALSNCIGGIRADGSTGDVCANDWGIQRMTTFALALGIPGQLNFTPDYRTATSGDYFDLVNGLNGINWPDPKMTSTDSQIPQRIDDLWHAAVNSGGIYFSAESPTEVVKALQDALGAIDKKVGAGAAAATSTLNPTSGDNAVFVASYTTVQWTGNLEKRLMDTTTGATSQNALWCIEDVLADSCNGTLVGPDPGTGVVQCYPLGGGSPFEVNKSCVGTLKTRITAANADNRNILMNVSGALQQFIYPNVSAAGLAGNYSNSFLRNNLSQRSTLTTPQLDAIDGNKLMAYLRGQYAHDMRPTNPVNDQLFRLRSATLGDIIESQPSYMKKPVFSWGDPGYSGFVSDKAGRGATVYVGANDGMMHAFNADDGNERWAFVPSPVIPNMWRLADDMYSTNHRNFVNGAPLVTDFCIKNSATCTASDYRTILVAGLNAGGRGYYALDVTDPVNPKFLWEFTPTQDANLGYTYGQPVVTKRPDGKWVVLISSGYNNGTGSGSYTPSPVTEIANSPVGDGKGYLYVLDPVTGAILTKMTTGEGTAASPSGLAKISGWVDDLAKDNTTTYVYGGDLNGNIWRFNMTTNAVFKLATLKDASGKAQPITTRPELGLVDGKRVVYVGTGKYLEQSDLTNQDVQTVYAIQDDNATTTLTSPRGGSLVQQTLTDSGTTRTVTNNTVNWSSKRGWYADYPVLGERQNVDGLLAFGTLVMPTTVPTADVCSPGGYSWLNFFNYRSGGGVGGNTAGLKLDSPIVGLNLVYLGPEGNKSPKVSTVQANNPDPKIQGNVKFSTNNAGFTQKKVMWRELSR